MDRQMVTGYNPQAAAQKTASTKGTDGEKGQEVKSQALSLFLRKSGFAMARLVSIAIVLSSCSYNIAPTTAQKEQKKFERFKLSPNEALIYSGSVFLGYSMGKNFVQLKGK